MFCARTHNNPREAVWAYGGAEEGKKKKRKKKLYMYCTLPSFLLRDLVRLVSERAVSSSGCGPLMSHVHDHRKYNRKADTPTTKITISKYGMENPAMIKLHKTGKQK
jgi:hypothetical protein